MNFFLMDAPPWLPVRAWMSWFLPVGWSLVLACASARALLWCWPQRATRFNNLRSVVVGALALAVWVACVALPGAWSPAYWLGLAFQAPSVLTVLCCAWCLYRSCLGAPHAVVTPAERSAWLVLAWLGVVLGWLLVLDVFAVLPVSLYAWGFTPLALGVVAGLSVLPGSMAWQGRWHMVLWLAPLTVLLFVFLRLPTGNVWDAVLDPWLWVGLQGYLLRRGIAQWRSVRVRA